MSIADTVFAHQLNRAAEEKARNREDKEIFADRLMGAMEFTESMKEKEHQRKMAEEETAAKFAAALNEERSPREGMSRTTESGTLQGKYMARPGQADDSKRAYREWSTGEAEKSRDHAMKMHEMTTRDKWAQREQDAKNRRELAELRILASKRELTRREQFRKEELELGVMGVMGRLANTLPVGPGREMHETASGAAREFMERLRGNGVEPPLARSPNEGTDTPSFSGDLFE